MSTAPADPLYLPALMADNLGVSRTLAKDLISTGLVRLNGERVTQLNLPADTTGWLQVGRRRRLRLGPDAPEQTKLRVGGKRYIADLPLDEVRRLVEQAKASRLSGDNSTLDVTTMEGRIGFVSLADCVAAEEYEADG